jgi:UDPglucose 6-dehydrogenase
MKVCIVGTGYVGLVSGVCLAAKGHEVVCVDSNSEIVEKLNAGIPTIYEKNLSELLKEVISLGKFHVTQDLNEALEDVSVVIVAVGTPSEAGVIDLSYIERAIKEIGEYISKTERFIAVVIKSTVIPGTTDKFIRDVLEKYSGKKVGAFGLGMNPEFLREGEAIFDFMNPDRIVMGYETSTTLDLLEELYRPWDVDKIRVNTRTAELIKYTNNFLLATQISAINEVANFSAALGGIDIMDVVNGVHLDKRWNPKVNNLRVDPEILKYLMPGCGFGGSCFPKDVQALRSQGESLGLPMKMMNAVLDVNEAQPHQVAKILEVEIIDFSKKSILILGLSFKPDTDDVRESPALKIARDLIKKNANLFAHDPVAVNNFKMSLGLEASEIKFVDHWRDFINQVDIIILITPWIEYKELFNLTLNNQIIFDARRSLPHDKVGYTYYRSIGLGRR